jgi:uncharacterized iron-regulated membrane protein
MEGMIMPVTVAATPGLTAAVATADARGLVRPYTVSIPADPATAYTAARVAQRVEDTRILYIDPATGGVRADVRYDQFGVGAKAFEWGIAVHEGRQYGWINRYVMLSGCIAIWLLGVSAIVMWWKRRPKGRLAAPVAPPGPRARVAVLAIVLPLAILYPLTGLSLVVALVLDRIVRAFGPSPAPAPAS